MENRIRQLREEKHMTQIRLSIELEVSQEAVSAYENNKHYPSVTTLLKLSDIFHASCDYILGISDTRYPCNANQLSKDEILLLEKWKLLDTNRKEVLLAYADGLIAFSMQNRS